MGRHSMERGRDTSIRQVGSQQTGRCQFFYDGQGDDIICVT